MFFSWTHFPCYVNHCKYIFIIQLCGDWQGFCVCAALWCSPGIFMVCLYLILWLFFFFMGTAGRLVNNSRWNNSRFKFLSCFWLYFLISTFQVDMAKKLNLVGSHVSNQSGSFLCIFAPFITCLYTSDQGISVW